MIAFYFIDLYCPQAQEAVFRLNVTVKSAH